MTEIYLDNSATTPLCEAAKKAMCAAMAQYGNPSSLHILGAEAARLLKQSRTEVGEALGERFLKDGQLLFTSCGTEATALAIQGTARAKSRPQVCVDGFISSQEESERARFTPPICKYLLIQSLTDVCVQICS